MTDEKPLRVLSLGWGVQSWTLAAMIAMEEMEPVDFAIHSDTTHEASGTYTHAKKWTPWLEERGVKIITVQPDSASVISGDTGVMIPAHSMNADGPIAPIRRQCTYAWKIAPIRQYIRTLLPEQPKSYQVRTQKEKDAYVRVLQPDMVHMITGISWDEALRMKDSPVKYIKHVYPLVDMRIKRSDCILWLERNGLDVPPKSSCVFCPYHSRASWKDKKRDGGKDWDDAVAVDLLIRDKIKGQSLFLHPYREPLSVAVKIPEDQGVKQLMLGDSDPTCDSGYCFN